jgi:ribosomal protein L11 methyltransferase
MVTKAYIAIARAYAKGNLAPHECAHHCRPSVLRRTDRTASCRFSWRKPRYADSACAAFEDDAGHWQVAIHFRNIPDEAGLRELVRLAAGETAADALSIERVAANDWVAESLAGLKPVRAGRFVVHGAHDRAGLRQTTSASRSRLPSPSAPVIMGRPAAVFSRLMTSRNAGAHSTCSTSAPARACLRSRRHDCCARVWPPETSTPVAVRAARENARQNHAASMISFVRAAGVRAQVIRERGPYDLIFANILMGPLTRLATPVRKLAAPGAHVVLSGLLPSHANAIVSIYGAQGLVLERRIVLEAGLRW